MFKSMSSEGHLPGGQSSSSPAVHGVTSPGMDSQETSWIGLLSRPAITFLQKYLSGRARTPALSDKRADWIGGGLNTSLVEEESEFLRQLDEMMPQTQQSAPHLTYLRCQRGGAAGLLEPSGGGTLPWLTADSFREMGIQSAEEMELNLGHENQMGYLSSVRTVLSHVWLSSMSSQEMRPTGRMDWNPPGKGSGGKSRTWWGSFWGGEETSQKGPLLAEEGALTGQLCPQQLLDETKAPVAETTIMFVRRTLGENTGPADHKEEPTNNGGLQTVQNRERSTPDQRLGISNHLSRSEAAAACGEVALLTPDQDNGYSSLEEEHFHLCHLSAANAPSEEKPQQESESAEVADIEAEMEHETSEEAGEADEEERGAAELNTPQCQNKAIAFIMGCPCSDDDSSGQSDGDSSDDEDEDDDGFDSEGSSDLSDSTDEDETSDSDADSEADRLWSSLCQSEDPYNPRNFTARLHTSSTPPRNIPASTPPSSTESTPDSSPDLTPLPLSSTPSDHDVWDDSTSASEVDEAESLRLWSSFSCSSDPYSPFNFQATIRTREPSEARPRARVKKASQTPPRSPRHTAASPPEYRKEEAEERLDSGFSEPSTSSSVRSGSAAKKVRFSDNVEEFFASCGEEEEEEDRRGPWEELARDRCRFLRRCQEVEESIAYCLQPQHRGRVYRRLAELSGQDA